MAKRSKINLHFEYFDAIKKLCTDDEDWYKIFDDAAHGILRTGFKLTNNKLVYRGRGKVFEVMLNEDHATTLEECKKLFRKAGVKTKNEIETAKEKMRKKRDQGWSSIRRIDDKHFYLNRYVVEQLKSKGLSAEDEQDFRSMVFLKVLTGEINNNSVLFKDGKICRIDIS